ncbi:MAG: toll/interleukin-1 receptor domain-containing protein, partial [Novosphingobium sp.]
MNQPSVPHPAAHYRAFVSYSHTDADFAVWLHRSIERFRLTPESGQGLVERLVPVFIDRAELPAAPDLSAQVKQALADSAALIVVASPRARASRWVDQEITLFRTLHPDRPVLAALIDGDPETAFPAALSRHGEQQFEPLAADFRKGADGRQLG